MLINEKALLTAMGLKKSSGKRKQELSISGNGDSCAEETKEKDKFSWDLSGLNVAGDETKTKKTALQVLEKIGESGRMRCG